MRGGPFRRILPARNQIIESDPPDHKSCSAQRYEICQSPDSATQRLRGIWCQGDTAALSPGAGPDQGAETPEAMEIAAPESTQKIQLPVTSASMKDAQTV